MHPQNRKMEQVRDVAQSVEYTSGGREVARSNRVIPTRLQGFSLQPFFFYPLLSSFTTMSLSCFPLSSSWQRSAATLRSPHCRQDSSFPFGSYVLLRCKFYRYHFAHSPKITKYSSFLKTLLQKFGANRNNHYLCRVKLILFQADIH